MIFIYKLGDYAPTIALGISGISFIFIIGYFTWETIDLRKTAKEYRKYTAWKKSFDVRQFMLPTEPVLTPSIKKLIEYVESFGFQVKYTHFIQTAYMHAEQAIILNPNTAQREGIFPEHSVLWSIAHEFGHGLAMTKGFAYCPRRDSKSEKRTIILDEQLAWFLANKCLKRLFPNDRDLFKSFDHIYGHCIQSYINHYVPKVSCSLK